MGQKITFDGHFGKFFVLSLGLMVLTVFTIGLAGPYWAYWTQKYFFTHLHINGQRIIFRGHFGEFFLTFLGLLLLSVFTVGLALPYVAYWSYKYFFSNMELAAPAQAVYYTAPQPALAPPPAPVAPAPDPAPGPVPPTPVEEPAPVKAPPQARKFQFSSPDGR